MRKLTKKQQIVEDYLLTGLSYKEIAYELNSTYTVVKCRATEIFKKRNVHSVPELLAVRFKDIMLENKMLKKQVEILTVYKQRWEYLRDKAFERRG